jgi:hypothetical protein
MGDITCTPFRTPACDNHLKNNEDDDCPWCRIEELEAENERLRNTIAKFFSSDPADQLTKEAQEMGMYDDT